MIQTLWFFVKISLLIGGAVWLVSQQGSVVISFLGYNITAHVGVFFLGLIIFIIAVVFFLRLVRAIFNAPTAIAEYNKSSKRQRGYRALTQGLVAVAAGNAKKATEFSRKTQKLFPERNGLPMLLEAQAARLRGEEGLAQNRFEELMKDKDAAFLGIRGLLKSAMDAGQIGRALDFAKKAQSLYPTQGWVIKCVYDLEIKNHLWSDVLETGKKAQKYAAIPKSKILSDRVAIHLMRHDYESDKGVHKLAMRELEQAYKLDPYFVPSVTRLARHYIERGKNRKAKSLVEKAWAQNPHPDLVEIWDMLAPENSAKNQNKRLKWYEDLVALKPDSTEGQMAAARAAMDMGLWGEAKAYLMVAEKIYPSARLFRLRAMVEQNSTHNEDAFNSLIEKAAEALPDKVWYCRETGMVYDTWSALSMPQERFNTIIWGIPSAAVIPTQGVIDCDDVSGLLIDPAVG